LVCIFGFLITCTSLLAFGSKISAGSGRLKGLKPTQKTPLCPLFEEFAALLRVPLGE